jgi:small subunit ribosomal protein S17
MLTKLGTITSAAMQDSVTVTVHRRVMHKLYKKSFRSSKKFLADSKGIEDVQIGDEVRIQECRPLSKNKHFRIIEVVKRVPRVSEMTEGKGVEEAMQRHKDDKEEKDDKENKDDKDDKDKKDDKDTTSTSSATSQ